MGWGKLPSFDNENLAIMKSRQRRRDQYLKEIVMHTPVTPITVAEFIADRLADIDKTQREVAEACGFETPNVITMFKKGQMKVPLDRVGSLAKALDAKPTHQQQQSHQEKQPQTRNANEEILH